MRIAGIVLIALVLAGCGGPIDITKSYWPEGTSKAGEFAWPGGLAWAEAKGATLATGPYMSMRDEVVRFAWNETGLYGQFSGYTSPILTVACEGPDGRLQTITLLMPGTATGDWGSPAGGPATSQPAYLAKGQSIGANQAAYGYGAVLPGGAPAADIMHLRTRYQGPVAKPGQHLGVVFISWELLGWPGRPKGHVRMFVMRDGPHGKHRLKKFILPAAGKR